MRIRKIDTNNKHDVHRFVQFPNQLYKDNPYFCPALESEARGAMDRAKHPFYKHSFADFFVAESEGDVIGRIAAIHNTRHNEYRMVKTAFFSSFDVVEDFHATQGLFEAVFEWSRARGREDVLGPRGLTGSDASGVLVEGFDQRAVMGDPYNHPYYDQFIRQMGFEKLTDHISGYRSTSQLLSPRVIEIAEKIRERRGYQIKSFTSKDEMKLWAPCVMAVQEEAFSDTFEWHPNTPEENEGVIESLITISDPRLVKVVLKDDKIIGFGLVYPDLSDSLRRYHGKTHLLALLDLQREFKCTKWLIAGGVGMLPAYQNMGGNAVLYTDMWRTIQELGQYEHGELVQVNEMNFPSRSDMESLDVKWTKRHRTYKRNLKL